MLNIFKNLFQDTTNNKAQPFLNSEQKQLACAALMVEVATIDEHFTANELATLTQHLQQQFNLEHDQLEQLTRNATDASEHSSSLYQFTRLVNDNCSPEDKFELLKGMWKVARADDQIDKYEEYIIRKVSELIYVPHSEFIRAKQYSRNG